MALHRRAAKRDAVEPEIFQAWRAIGCAVLPISTPGGPDAAVFCPLVPAFLAEIKGKRGRLTPAQKKWRETWTGPQPHIVRDVETAIKLATGR